MQKLADMAKEGARHLVSNIGGVLPKHEVLKSTEEYVSFLLHLSCLVEA